MTATALAERGGISWNDTEGRKGNPTTVLPSIAPSAPKALQADG
jgi:hypothetical protein